MLFRIRISLSDYLHPTERTASRISHRIWLLSAMQNTVLLHKNLRPMSGGRKTVSAAELDEYCSDCEEEFALMILDMLKVEPVDRSKRRNQILPVRYHSDNCHYEGQQKTDCSTDNKHFTYKVLQCLINLIVVSTRPNSTCNHQCHNTTS